MTARRWVLHTHDEHGFSLVEVVVTMFLVALMAVGILPLIIGLTQSSVTNRTLLAATSLANAELAKLQAAFPTDPSATSTSCTALRSLQSAAPAVDSRNNLEARLTVGACPASAAANYPSSVPVTVTVTQDGTTITVVESRFRVAIA